MIGLIKVTNYLLDQQLRRLERDFVEEGGLKERMTRARLSRRGRRSKQALNGPLKVRFRNLGGVEVFADKWACTLMVLRGRRA